MNTIINTFYVVILIGSGLIANQSLNQLNAAFNTSPSVETVLVLK